MSLPLNDSVIGHTFEIMRGAITPWQDAFYSFLFYLLCYCMPVNLHWDYAKPSHK